MTESHQIQFNNHLIEFIQKMQQLAPDEKKLFDKYYKYYRKFVDQGKRVEFIAEFIQYLSKYNHEVSTCDEGLFSEEEGYYPGKPIPLMKGIDFKRIWVGASLSEVSKSNIWKYFHTLYLIGTHVLKEYDRYQELLKKQQEIIYNLMQNLKYEKQIQKDAENLNQKEKENESSLSSMDLSDLFDENNIIIQIATEIAKDLNLSGGLSDPAQALGLLFGQDGSKLQEIVSRVGQRLTHVLQEKGMTEEQLLTHAKDMHDKLFNKLKGIPGMSNIEKISQQFAEEFTKGAQPSPNQDSAANQENLEKCKAMVQELTSNLRSNLTQMGLGDLDNFQQNIENMTKPAE